MIDLPTIKKALRDIGIPYREDSDGSVIADCPACEEGGKDKLKAFTGGGFVCNRFFGNDEDKQHFKAICEALGLSFKSKAKKKISLAPSVILGGRLTLTVSEGSRGRQIVTAKNCDKFLAKSVLKLSDAAARIRFAKSLGFSDDDFPIINSELIAADEKWERVMAAKSDDEDEKSNVASLLIELAEDFIFFHNSKREGFATVLIGNVLETFKVQSIDFKHHLSRLLYEKHKKVASATTLSDVLNVLQAKALYDGEEIETEIRVAGDDECIYLDLVNPERQAVKVTAEGWQIIESLDTPIKFRRLPGMLPLPTPVRGGNGLDELKKLVNIPEEQVVLLKASMVSMLRPKSSYPVVAISGGQGSAKSTLTRVIRNSVDPNTSALRAQPKTIEDLIIGGTNSHVSSFDNLSSISPELADALCRLSTGGGLGKRALYTDDGEITFDFKKPVILNGISQLATRPDLIDRCVLLESLRITKENRITDSAFNRHFEKVRPAILGGLLDKLSESLRNLPNVELKELPRMADFCVFGYAGFGEEFLKSYFKNINQATTAALENSPIATILLKFLNRQNPKVWKGTATELLEELEDIADEKTKRDKSFPKKPNVLSNNISRIETNLVEVGWIFTRLKSYGEKKERAMKFEYVENGGDNDGDDGGDDGSSGDCLLKTDAIKGVNPSRDDGDDGDDHLADSFNYSSSFSSSTPSSFSQNCNRGESSSPSSPSSPTDVKSNKINNLKIDDDFSEKQQKLSVNNTEENTYGIDDQQNAETVSIVSGDEATINEIELPEYMLGCVALDTETDEFDERLNITSQNAEAVGISLSYDGYNADYITDKDSWGFCLPEPDQTVIFHNAKFDLGVLERAGLPLPQSWEDTMIAAHLLDENSPKGLKPLAKKLLGVDHPETFKEVKTWRMIDPDGFTEYAKNDARYTFRLWQRFQPMLADQQLRKVYELEKNLVPVVRRMENAGMLIDVDALKALDEFIKQENKRLTAAIYELAGMEFKISSPAAKAAVLYDKLGLDCPKETPGGKRSVDSESLRELSGQHEIIDLMLELSQIDKLASSFTSALLKTLKKRGDGDRIKAEFNQLGAKTGRFTCRRPNLQQVPSRSELGKRLRSCFIAGEGKKLVVADWSQMELRVLAHYSKDPSMIEAFQSGADLHEVTAQKMFGKTEISKEERTIAKMINFGIAYGITPKGLYRRLATHGVSVSLDDCEQFVKNYFKTYRGIGSFLEKVEQTVKKRGYVKSISGRRRRVAGKDNRQLRQAKNFIIQASAGDLAKTALLELAGQLPDGAQIISMIHDEFVIECDERIAEDVQRLAEEIMSKKPANFAVDMEVEAKIVDCWADAK